MSGKGYPWNLAEDLKALRVKRHEFGNSRLFDDVDIVKVCEGRLSNPVYVRVLDGYYRKGLSVEEIANSEGVKAPSVGRFLREAKSEIIFKMLSLFRDDIKCITNESSVRALNISVSAATALENAGYMKIGELRGNDKWLAVRGISSSVKTILQYLDDFDENGVPVGKYDRGDLQYSLSDIMPEFDSCGVGKEEAVYPGTLLPINEEPTVGYNAAELDVVKEAIDEVEDQPGSRLEKFNVAYSVRDADMCSKYTNAIAYILRETAAEYDLDVDIPKLFSAEDGAFTCNLSVFARKLPGEALDELRSDIDRLFRTGMVPVWSDEEEDSAEEDFSEEEAGNHEEEEEYSQIFLVIMDYGDSVVGMDISKRNDMPTRTRVVSKAELKGINAKVISIDANVRHVLAGDSPLKECGLFRDKTVLVGELSKNGISSLAQLSQLTKSEFVAYRGCGRAFADTVERELKYRGLGDFRKAVVVPTPREVVSTSKSERVDVGTKKLDKSVEELGDSELPLAFRIWSRKKMAHVRSIVDDSDLFEMYKEYLYANERLHDIYVLENLLSGYSNPPIGVIHVMEGLCGEAVFYKEQLSDRWYMVLMELYTMELADGLQGDWKKELYKNICYICVDKFGVVDLRDVYKFCSEIDWQMGATNAAYVYKYYRPYSSIFIKSPDDGTYEGSYADRLVELCSKAGVLRLSNPMYIRIDKMCKNLDVSYEYAVEGLSKANSIAEIRLLMDWFNFNYTAMQMFLTENKDFKKVVEVA